MPQAGVGFERATARRDIYPFIHKDPIAYAHGTGMLTAITCALFPLAAQAQTGSCAVRQPATDSAALAFENAWAVAGATHDTAALKCMLAKDFVDTSWRGKLRTRPDVLASEPAAPPGFAQRFSDWRVTRFGNTAIIRGLNSITSASNKTVATIRFTDVLRYADDR